jgi:Kef-type K+ transport system membrane component KefB
MRLGNLRQSSTSTEVRKSGPIWLIVASMLGVLVWLVFILIYALYSSGGFSLFQNVVVFIVSLGITGVLIGLMWVILGPEKYRTWNQ